VELSVRDLGPPAIDVPEAPPVGEGGQEGPWIFVKAIMVSIPDKPRRQENDASCEPVLPQELEQRFGDAAVVHGAV